MRIYDNAMSFRRPVFSGRFVCWRGHGVFSMAVRNANVLAFYDAPLYHYRILEESSFHGSFTLKKYTSNILGEYKQGSKILFDKR